MRFITKLILIIAFCYPLQLVLPFWIVAVVAFLINLLIRTNGWSSFFSSFLGIFILWYSVAYWIDSQTHSILTNQIAQLLNVDTPILLVITGVVGGLLAGFSGLTAQALWSMRTEKSNSSKYH